TPLTSKDVKASWDRGMSDASPYEQISWQMLTVNSPAQLTTPDDYTVVLQTERATSFTLKTLVGNDLNIMSAEQIAQHATADDPTAHEYFHTHTFGSAAYVLGTWTAGVEWDFDPNPNYWNPDALKNGGVVNRLVPDAQQRLNLLLNGDVDLAFQLSPKDLASLKDNPDIQLFDFEVPWPYYLGMNNTIPPFDNVAVRQAINYAIPYDTIIDKVMYGFAKPLKSPVPAGMPSGDDTFWNYAGGPAKAAEVLADAGVDNISFDLAIQIGQPFFEQIAVWIQSAVQQIGGNVNIVKMTDSEYYDKFDKRELQAFIAEWYSWVNDPIYHLYWNFLSTNVATNATAYTNPEVDRLIMDGLYETDPAKREAMSKQAQKIIVEEAPWALLFQINYVVAARKNIKGFNWNPDTGCRYWMVSKD
ncbi:MAG: ABC transporter substrate-binding protein, partial [Thermomicrobiales bacterium]|nr:ABC transporter substrate-binding protein [Thermomicrobiales bacterium]